MRLLILGAGGRHRTEAALARAAHQLGHEARVIDALGLRRSLGPLAPRVIRWLVQRAEPELILCTRHAISAGESTLATLLRARRSAFWYFDALAPLPRRVVALATMVLEVYATYGFQTAAFRRAGIEAQFLPQGVDPGIDQPATEIRAPFRCDLSFLGSGQFPRRHEILRRFSDAGTLQIRGPSWSGAPSALPVVGGYRARFNSSVVEPSAPMDQVAVASQPLAPSVFSLEATSSLGFTVIVSYSHTRRISRT